MSTAKARLMRRARRYLSIWATNIGLDNDDGLTDINSDAENFCCELLNIVLDKQLRNMNLLQMNFPAIDLADGKSRICVQVTSTAGSEKIHHTLERFFAHNLDRDYDKLIVMILGKKKNYRADFPKKAGFDFDPARDVWDIQKLLSRIAGLTMPQLERVDAYLREQFSDLEELLPPMDLPVLSALDDASFLGRDRELDEIAARFEKNEKILFLSGLGGIGKSELAIRFAHTRWGSESYFVHFTKNWRQTVLENIAPRIRGLNREGADQERIFRDAMAELKSRGSDELLILDNVDQEEASLTQLKRELSELSLRIIITTRTDTGRAIPVSQLRQEELLGFFELHGSEATPEEQRELIEAVDGHTLTVDLMARALRPGRRAATAEKLLCDLADATVRRVETAYHGAPVQARIVEHLKVVFRMVELEADERMVLRYAALLPGSGMPEELFLSPVDQDVEDAMDSLTRNGWLRWKDEMILIHPVIRKVCIEELKPSDENCGNYLNGMIDQYDKKNFNQVRFSQMAEMLTNASCWLEDTQGRWALKAGERWRDVGDFVQAKLCSIRAMEKMEKNPSRDEAALAQAYNNVGCTYGDFGDHRRELEYQMKALVIREKVLRCDHPDLAQSYNNVGTTYGDLGEPRCELEYQLKALVIWEKALSPDHPDLAIVYNNVGNTYIDLGEYRTALKYLQKARVILENVRPSEHPNLAKTYGNLGLAYSALGDCKKAMEYHQKDLAIFEKVLSENHTDIAISCCNIAWNYHKMGQYQDAAQYMRRAADIIMRSALPKDHPRRMNYLEWADQFEKDARIQQAMLSMTPKPGFPPIVFPKKK